MKPVNNEKKTPKIKAKRFFISFRLDTIKYLNLTGFKNL